MSRQLLRSSVGTSGDLRLWRTDDYGSADYELAINGVFAMATYNRCSAVALYDLAAGILGRHQAVDVLVGGLGVGHTVAAAAADPQVRCVDVVEIESDVRDWNRRYFAPYNGHCLDDARVHVHVEEFGAFVARTAHRYDVVCMDVDNGPGFLIMDGNASLYGVHFLRELRRRHIRDDGVLSVWSSGREPALEQTLSRVMGEVSVAPVEEVWGRRPVTYYIYLARATPAARSTQPVVSG